MSNAHIAERLIALADQLELRMISVRDFADQFYGHTQALEGIRYAQLKEAQMVSGQLQLAIEEGQDTRVDLQVLANWLRDWVAAVPGHGS